MKCPDCGSDKMEVHCETNKCNWAKCKCGVVMNKRYWTKRNDSGQYNQTKEVQ